MIKNVNILDIESNNLHPYSDTIWIIVVRKAFTDKTIKIFPFIEGKEESRKKLVDFIFSDEENGIPIIAGHNILGFDMWVIWHILEIPFSNFPDSFDKRPCVFFDTYYASQYLNPDRESHSLKNLSKGKEVEKIDYRQLLINEGKLAKNAPEGAEFLFYDDHMIEYCETDTLANEGIFVSFYKQITDENSWSPFKLGQKDFYLMKAQEFTGFKFDIDLAKNLEKHIIETMEEISSEIKLPPRKLKKAEIAEYKFPAKIFKADGTLTSHMVRYIEKHNAILHVEDNVIFVYDFAYPLEPNIVPNVEKEMTLDDQQDLKDYFLSQGWEPTLWNYKKDKKGKFIRNHKKELIPTTPKIQENSKICPNLLKLEGDLSKKIVKYLSYKNRLGTLQGWLKDPRLEFDGRISAGASGIANTHRQKHIKVVNVPKAQNDIILGKEFRSLWCVDEGFSLIGCDQSALEARCEAHWIYNYDKEGALELINGDLHSRNAQAFFPEETGNFNINDPNFDKDDPNFKPFRSISKNVKYAIGYGAQAKKIADTARKTEEWGKKVFDTFWKINPGLKLKRDELLNFYESIGSNKWILGIDGRRLYLRSPHSIINLLFQSTAAIIMQVALHIFDLKMGGLLLDEKGRPYYLYKDKIVKRVGFFHDEFEVEAEEEIQSDLKRIMENCMVRAGEVLKLNVPLIGEAKIGKNWKDVH